MICQNQVTIIMLNKAYSIFHIATYLRYYIIANTYKSSIICVVVEIQTHFNKLHVCPKEHRAVATVVVVVIIGQLEVASCPEDGDLPNTLINVLSVVFN